MRLWRRCGAIALSALTATCLPAQGSAEPESVCIRYSAPKGCPDQTAFIRALRQRTARFRLSRGTEHTRAFLVTITQADPLVAGRLEVQSSGAKPSLRSVRGKTCDEVMAALAFMTALAIDPSAPSAPSARSPSASSPAPSPPGSASPVAASPAARTNRAARSSAADALAPALGAAPSAASSAPPPAAGRSHESPSRRDASSPRATPSEMVLRPPAAPSNGPAAARWRWSAGGHGGVSLRMSPSMGLGGLLFVEAAAPGAAVLGPVLRAGLFLNQSGATLASGAGAGFQWAAGMVEGCPLRLGVFDSRVAFHACLAFHLGLLRGQGRSLDRPEKTNDLWADVGPVARVRAAISARFFLEAQGMLALPLRRLTYDVYDAGPSRSPTTVFTVPWVGALAGIGVAYEFR
jgi:hypothetical protein